MAKPYKLNGVNSLGIARGDGGRFVREDATPPNPIEEEEDGKQPQEWAPGVGQGSLPIRQGDIPWPNAGPAVPTVPGGKPYKL